MCSYMLYLLSYYNYHQENIAPGVAILDQVLVLAILSHVVIFHFEANIREGLLKNAIVEIPYGPFSSL
jgi:hypothetical protein